VKIINLKISLKKYSMLTVQVPDDFNPAHITHFVYSGVIAEAARNSLEDYEWECPHNEPCEVESYKVLEGDELATEIADYGEPVDISESLKAEIKKQNDAIAAHKAFRL